jgi:hypothetical protein
MKRYRYLLALILFSFLWFCLSSSSSQKKNKLYFELGFTINPSAGSNVVNFMVLGLDSTTHKIVSKKPITEAEFVMYGKGVLKIEANPQRIDFFREAGVDCGLILDDPKSIGGVLIVDTLWEEMKPICLPVWDIWKLRYSIHPKYGKGASAVPQEDIGWSANRWRPSPKQTQYLAKNYGINHIADFFHGPSMFELFYDMQNPDWIRMYREIN